MTKQSLSVLTCLLAVILTLTPMDVHAKRLGGGRSIGRSYSTTRSQPSNLGSQASQQSTASTSGGFTSTASTQSRTQSQAQPIPTQTTVNTGTTGSSSAARSFMAGVAGGAVGGVLAGSVMNALSDNDSGQSASAAETATVAGASTGAAASAMSGDMAASATPASAPLPTSTPATGDQLSNQQTAPSSNRGVFSMFNLMALIALSGFGYAIFKKLQGRRSPVAKASPFAGGAAVGLASGGSLGQFGDGYRTDNRTDSRSDTGNGFGKGEDVPFNLPPNFDLTGFLRRARDHYRTVQIAWNNADMQTIRGYVVPELYEYLANERSTLEEIQHTEVMFVDAEIVRADNHHSGAEVSVRFTGRYRDLLEQVEDDINDVWHLERAHEGAPWLIVGIE